jgi:Domain of unknown function (DUF5658)
MDNKQLDGRTLGDRRDRSTPFLSRYTFRGKRRTFRRSKERLRGGYVDRYPIGLLILLSLILVSNFLDSLFTLAILDRGGSEVNPIVGAAIELCGDRFWLLKSIWTSFFVIILCLHSAFNHVTSAILGLSGFYLLVVIYEIFLIFD